MKVIIVNCFDTYEDRVMLIEKFFRRKGNEVMILTSNFRHFHKDFRNEATKDQILIETRPYYKNISVTRMVSHWYFSCGVIDELPKYNPDLVYVLVPPNSLVKKIAGFKKENLQVKIIFDVIDLWPESLPIPYFKKSLFGKMWMNLRNKNLKMADYVITECDLYQQRLNKYLRATKTKTVWLARKKIQLYIEDKTSKNKVALCCLGSINNIIDIDIVGDIIAQIAENKKVELHIIGDGSTKEELVNIAKKNGAIVFEHGTIYDPFEKQKIFNVCDYGLNIMKTSVCVGLTMKSIDYFEGGLPLLNNIQGDTWQLVDKHYIGVNFEKGQKLQLKHVEKAHVRAFFEEKFADKVFEEKMQSVYDEVVCQQCFAKEGRNV